MSKREKKPKSKARRIIEWVGIGLLGCVFTFALIAQIDAMVHKDENWGQQLRFGVGSFVVRTNSMEPEYKVGSAIITYKKSPEEIYNWWNADRQNARIDITFIYQRYSSFLPDDPTLTKQTNTASYSELYGSPMTHRLREVHIDPSKPIGSGHFIFIVAGINPTEEWAADQYQAFPDNYILGTVIANSDFLGKVFSFIASPWGLFGLLLIPAFYLVISSTADIFRILKQPEEEAAGGDPNKRGTVSVIPDSERERLKQEMLMQMLEEKKKAKEAAKKESSEEEKPANENETAAEPAPNNENVVEEKAPKAEKKDTLGEYSDAQKAELRKQMLAQIMAEKKAGKPKEDPTAKVAKDATAEAKEKPAPKAKEEKRDSLGGYSDAEKAELRKQMLAQIMAEKKAQKAKKEEVKEKDDEQA